MKAEDLARKYLEFGEPNKALVLLKEIARLDPKNSDKRSAYLYAMHFANIPQEEIFREHLMFSRDFETRSESPSFEAHSKKIRIGYISPDLCAQASRYCLEPITTHHNKEIFEIFFYCNSPYHDIYTDKFRSHADGWREIQGMNTYDIVSGIRSDKIDILVDLAGHTSLNNLPVFMSRVAPIQVSWFGYMDTTGLVNMDYRLTDEWRTPRDREKFYTEKLVYIPNSYTFKSYENLPPITPPPMTTNGYITFGSFNSSQKINIEVINLWAEILHSIPNAKLLFVTPRDESYVEALLKNFNARGIDTNRIVIRERSSMPNFLSYINDVDVGLDPFPYTGGVTTYHALSLGVPTITLEGDVEFARNCGAIMREAGISALTVCKTKDEYVTKAIEFSKNPELLLKLRKKLPQELRSREKDTVKYVEEAFLKMFEDRLRTSV
ncbi:MAG: hypothetical protein Q7S19_01180 [bacterium]|nr:hypothetical protein [bacterium]